MWSYLPLVAVEIVGPDNLQCIRRYFAICQVYPTAAKSRHSDHGPRADRQSCTSIPTFWQGLQASLIYKDKVLVDG